MFETITTTSTVSAPTKWISLANVTSTLEMTTTSGMDFNSTKSFLNATNVGIGEEANITDLFQLCNPTNPDFNCSVDDFLGFQLGAKQMPLATALWVSSLFFSH